MLTHLYVFVSSCFTYCQSPLTFFVLLTLAPLGFSLFFFLNDTAPTEIYTLPLHDALPICALNPQVTQANIASTICRPGWPRTIRPPISYTNALKLKQMKERHLPSAPSSYEEDHFVPLELGGHPTNPLNLFPQLWAQARMKDKWENTFNRAVCALRMTLAVAQQTIKNPATWR